MSILTLQQYYNEILILQQHYIYNVLNGHCKIPAIFQRNILEIFSKYYGAMWEEPEPCRGSCIEVPV